MKEENFQWFTARVQFLVYILTILFVAFGGYFGIIKQIELLSYRTTQIENDRAIRWSKHEILAEEQSKCMTDIEISLAQMQADISYIKRTNVTQ